MAKKVVTLYIDDSNVQLLVTTGKRIKKCASLSLEQGLVQGSVVVNEAEVAGKIKQLLKEQKVGDKKIVLGLSGLHSFTCVITLPKIPNSMLAEAVVREAKRLLPVPLEQLYLSWQIIPTNDKKIWVFAVGVPCTAADSILNMLRKIGLIPYLMDVKPLTLLRTVKDSTAVIVDVRPTEFDIAILGDGIPHPIRTIPLTGRDLSWQEKYPIIRDDLDRTMKFYDSNNPDNTLSPVVPIYVSGELAGETAVCQYLSEEMEHPVIPISSPLTFPDGIDVNKYMVNIGLALMETAVKARPVPMIANLDVLPSAYRPKSFSLVRVLALTTAIAVIGLRVPQITLIQLNTNKMEAMNSQLNTVNHVLLQKRQQMQQLKKSTNDAQIIHDTFAEAVDTLNSNREIFNTCLKTVVNYLPESVVMSSISHDGSTININLESVEEKTVLNYAWQLQNTNLFSEVNVAQIVKEVDGEASFILVCKVKGSE